MFSWLMVTKLLGYFLITRPSGSRKVRLIVVAYREFRSDSVATAKTQVTRFFSDSVLLDYDFTLLVHRLFSG